MWMYKTRESFLSIRIFLPSLSLSLFSATTAVTSFQSSYKLWLILEVLKLQCNYLFPEFNTAASTTWRISSRVHAVDNLNSLIYAQVCSSRILPKEIVHGDAPGWKVNRPFIYFCNSHKALEIVYLRHRLSFLFRIQTRVK